MYWGLSAEGLKALTLNEISDRVPARRDVPLKNKRLERLLQMKLLPVDLAIAEYAEYNPGVPLDIAAKELAVLGATSQGIFPPRCDSARARRAALRIHLFRALLKWSCR
jgi:hypothetical protein